MGLFCPTCPRSRSSSTGPPRGAVVTTVNALYTADEVGSQLSDAGASWLFTVSPFLERAAAAAQAAGIPAERLVVLDGGDLASAAGHPSLADIIDAAFPRPR
ncbi:amp-Dependent synthetase and ligase [Arthrobacter sp. Hiyo8]|nr:amp-Dependent synthetase and ligase [Arthrobacter sp. Hiyo8]